MTREELIAKIAKIKAELDQAEAALPAHTVRVHQMQKVMDLEEELENLEDQLAKLKG